MGLVVENPPASAGGVREAGSIPGWEDPLEKGTATHSSILVRRITWREEPGGLSSVGSLRVRHDWSDLACVHFTVLWWFWPHINMNQPQVYICPLHPEPSSHCPPQPIPLGCPREPTLGALLHASSLHWSSILHVVMYTFQCSSLKSSHPRLLPLNPKVSSLHLCLLCCLHVWSSVLSF